MSPPSAPMRATASASALLGDLLQLGVDREHDGVALHRRRARRDRRLAALAVRVAHDRRRARRAAQERVERRARARRRLVVAVDVADDAPRALPRPRTTRSIVAYECTPRSAIAGAASTARSGPGASPTSRVVSSARAISARSRRACASARREACAARVTSRGAISSCTVSRLCASTRCVGVEDVAARRGHRCARRSAAARRARATACRATSCTLRRLARGSRRRTARASRARGRCG